MQHNARLLSRARARLAEIREENAAQQQRRIRDVYARLPEVEQIDSTLRSHMIALARLAFSRGEGSEEKIAALQEENTTLQMRRAEKLVENGYPVTWTDEIYSCPLCHDTGKTASGGICSCLEGLYNKELSKELSTLLRSGDECFDRFDLTLYSDQYSDYCKDCKHWSRMCGESYLGEPGLGKSYLSACIGREVAEKGFTVYYDTAVAAFGAFEKQQFSRDPDEADAAAEKVRNMLTCDLMILDDLGTEVVTPVVTSALYTLINTRVNNKKPTIINTTLYPDELAARYTSSICSRLNGFYKTIHFAGSDIRSILKTRR